MYESQYLFHFPKETQYVCQKQSTDDLQLYDG